MQPIHVSDKFAIACLSAGLILHKYLISIRPYLAFEDKRIACIYVLINMGYHSDILHPGCLAHKWNNPKLIGHIVVKHVL